MGNDSCTGNDATHVSIFLQRHHTVGKQRKEHHLQISNAKVWKKKTLSVIIHISDGLLLVSIPFVHPMLRRETWRVVTDIIWTHPKPNMLVLCSIIHWAKQGTEPLQSLCTALFSFLAYNTSRLELQMLSASGHTVPFNGHYLWVPHSQAAWTGLCSPLSRDVLAWERKWRLELGDLIRTSGLLDSSRSEWRRWSESRTM